MTAQVVANHVFYAVCALVELAAAIPADWVEIVPAKVKPYLAGGVAVAVWVKGHRNQFVNPDGTPAWDRWIPGPKDQPKV